MKGNTRQKNGAMVIAQEALANGRKWLTEREAAGYLGISPTTLGSWRRTGRTTSGETPPKGYKHGSLTFYNIVDLDNWIRNQAERS